MKIWIYLLCGKVKYINIYKRIKLHIIMKNDKNVEIDPIKAKYIANIGFLKKLQLKGIKFKNYIKKKFKSEDSQNSSQMLFNIILYGIIGNTSSLLFGLSFNIINILVIGCAAWLIESKIVNIIKEILSSISIVKIYK